MNYKSVFEISIKDQFGNENMLKQYRGKVLMFVNTTGHCGNASQWPILNSIMDEYRDKNFQIIYVPTNDYCGSVTVEPYKEGIKDAKESFEYANKTYGIKDPFTELLSSRNEPWTYKVDEFIGEIGEWKRNYELHETVIQAPISDLYNFLILHQNKNMIQGNFHKFITNSKGVPVVAINNYILNAGPRHFNLIEVFSDKIILNNEKITDLIEKYISLDDLKLEDFPVSKVRQILFEIGEKTIKEFNSDIEYYLDKELLQWSESKNLYNHINDFYADRAKQDIIDIKNLINEILETDKTNSVEFGL